MNDYVSIITVNYNGKKYLEDFLSSLKNLNYPKDSFEVIVVDNASTDNSISYIKENFPLVRVIASNKNLGFGKGNNLGIINAKGNLCLLVNNDTVLEKDSLINIVDTYKRWSEKEKVGAVNAKLVLADSYLPLFLREAFFSDYVIPDNAMAINKNPFVITHEKGNNYLEKIFIPINDKYKDDLIINLTIRPFRGNLFEIFLEEEKIYEGVIKKIGKEKEIKLSISKEELIKYRTNLIQNAGNFYFRDGYGRDRGAVVFNHKQFYEKDMGQYDKEEVIPGFCGAGVLLNKEALNEVGYFDEDFFMYYEDADLSVRLFEYNWKIVYSPKSIIRHIHAGTSEEWSNFFVFNVERGRLLFVAKHWPRLSVFYELIKYVIKDTIIVSIYYIVRVNKKIGLEKFIIRFRVFVSIIIPSLLGLLRTKRLTSAKLKTFL